MSPMSPHQNSDETSTWPTRPGETSQHLQIPSPPTMNEIRDACVAPEETNHSPPAVAVTVEEADVIRNQESHAVPAAPLNQPLNGLTLPSPHVRFGGYLDEKGIIHPNRMNSNAEDGANQNDDDSLDEKKTAFVSTSRNHKTLEEEKDEIPTSAEDILQASLHFERSHPEKRFSSSLDHYYSSSTRQLYPSLEDVPLQEDKIRQESVDSVRTTVAAVVASAASAATNTSVNRSIVPEPPGTETYAIASATYEAVEDDGGGKIGVARAELDRAETDSPAYAVASVDNNMTCASAEATVLGTSETPEEALLAKLEAEDAELIALKRSAYGGAYEATASVQASFPDQQATVVSITEHDVHPSEISHGAVQAELIGEDYNDVPAVGTAAAATSRSLPLPTEGAPSHDTVYAVEEPAYAVVDSEATVIEDGGTWRAEEATVLNEDTSVPYSERKLPAVASLDPEHKPTSPTDDCFDQRASYSVEVPAPAVAVAQGCDAEVISLSEEVRYGEAAGDGNATSVAYAGGAYADDHAEVVGITEEYHPAGISGNEATAELVVEDFGAAVAIPGNGADGQAEIVEITEDFHPAEVSGNEALAELVAEDFGAAGLLPRAAADTQAQVMGISEDCHIEEISGNETQAELVGEEYNTDAKLRGEATAVRTDDAGEIQAATVVGYEDEGDVAASPGMTVSRATSYSTPRPASMSPSTRAYTAPAAVGTRIDPVDTPLTQATAELSTVVEDDWMRTPSLGGDSSSKGVIVMRPPMDGEDENAVAVASLEAYAETPARVVDETSCSPARDSQPAIAVASLNAYANAPAPPSFDDTDCSLVNRQPIQPDIAHQEPSISAASEHSNAAEPAVPPPRSFTSIGATSDGGSVESSTSMSTSTTRGFGKISSSFARGMELLFGDTKPSSGRRGSANDNTSLLQSVMSRQLLPWSVIYSEATNMWVATVNTNQKALDSKNVVEASKSLRAFSVVTEKQATCLAKAWSPPRMAAFNKNPSCHICKAKFAVFRRACHCRNCGVTICVSSNGCSRPWPAKMCPETYNIKKESFLNVCAACDFLCTSFRLALLEGDRDKAIALHATGNINIVTPFANVKGELFYPVHCAALGGNLELLKWLVDENCCPIKSVRISGRCRDSSNSFTEISTSKGRSLLGIALENRHVGIVRYLVVEKGIQLAGEKDINMDILCRNLELVLRLLPEDAANGKGNDHGMPGEHHDLVADAQIPESDEAGAADTNLRGFDTASDGSVSDACIICFDRSIDCVATPCGHQVCCLDCGKNITRCPVCAVSPCSFMRVFRP